jgi:3-methyladenine DNA glycosylase Tag
VIDVVVRDSATVVFHPVINTERHEVRAMSPAWNASRPKDDSEYFDAMSKAMFTAGLSWGVVEKKWSGFRQAFSDFSPRKVSRLSEKDIKALMKNPGIVRNERKIRATVQNAKTALELEKEFGSLGAYIGSFGKKEVDLQADIQRRFKHMGPSTTRTFLWMVGYRLTPTEEERKWMKGRSEHH